MAVGKVSLDDWDMLTSSLGWTGVFEPITPPASSMARLEMTSLAFMLVWVPLPVCQTLSGKWSSSLPAETSRAAATISSAFSGESLPRSALTRADASLRMPKARISGAGMWSSPIGKWSSERAVCGALVPVGGHLDGAHGVGFGAHGHGQLLSVEPPNGAGRRPYTARPPYGDLAWRQRAGGV